MKNSRAVDRGEHEMSPRAALSYSGQAEVQLPCADLAPTLEFSSAAGLPHRSIFPAEDPTVASLPATGCACGLLQAKVIRG